ncbi:hypothetical protein EC990741_A0187 [Escherichia coli 97.0259]|nr:hypothetical protein EC990741_A0187 [Escherichia coli 97.0259]
MGSCAAPSAKGDDKFITTDYLQQCQNFDGVTPSATEDKQVTGEGIIIQHMLYLFSQSVEGFYAYR